MVGKNWWHRNVTRRDISSSKSVFVRIYTYLHTHTHTHTLTHTHTHTNTHTHKIVRSYFMSSQDQKNSRKFDLGYDCNRSLASPERISFVAPTHTHTHTYTHIENMSSDEIIEEKGPSYSRLECPSVNTKWSETVEGRQSCGVRGTSMAQRRGCWSRNENRKNRSGGDSVRLLLRHDTRGGRMAWISVREPSAARRASSRVASRRALLFRSSLHIRRDQYSPDRACTHERR